ncbi:hypothetical protein [Mucilaginibacter paludis]|uniref:Uncharacterized protein n=1 Tax=Mucilaginibacter paludis DSM 18603 TaxID=714943 RepID=H1YBG4_9SPHI|nr:hypothetical protein [Mucilaginibacter paludis]EHQ25035.1 hypothetical protein Mucpa_0854 [Mucilaginibacter paludis DSM 18603]
MVFKSKLCLAGTLIVPLALVIYFALQVSRLSNTLLPIKATISSFESKGSHSNFRKVVGLDEYSASLVRYYEGTNMLFVKDFRDVIYQPPAPNEISSIYYLHPRLKSKTQRQISFYVQKADTAKLRQSTAQISYFYLQNPPALKSGAGYYTDLYLYVYRHHYGAGAVFVSLLLFIGSCIGDSWWYEQNKALLAYAILIVLIHILIFLF